jgi:hypothetical protein
MKNEEGTNRMARRIRLILGGFAVAALAVMGIAAAAAPPALAGTSCSGSCTGGGTVGVTVTVPSSLQFALSTSAVTLTEATAPNYTSPDYTYTVTTNDPAGYGVAVEGTDFTGTLGVAGDTIPVKDLAQDYSSTGGAPFTAVSFNENGSPVTVGQNSTATGGDTWTAYLDLAMPGSQVPDSYSTTITYVASGN